MAGHASSPALLLQANKHSGAVPNVIALKGTTMRLYLSAIVLTFAATAVIVTTCISYSSATRAAPINILQLR
jgi:hypothetical protein